MPDQQVTNPAGVWGTTPDLGRRVLPMVNGSTSTMEAFSVVSISTTAAATSATWNKFFTPALSIANPWVKGILQQDTIVGAVGDVVVEGFSLVAVSTSAIPAAGDQLALSTGLSQSTAANTPTTALVKTSTGTAVVGSIIGTCLSSTLDAYVNSSTNLAGFVPADIHKM